MYIFAQYDGHFAPDEIFNSLYLSPMDIEELSPFFDNLFQNWSRGSRWPRWLEQEFTDRKVRGSNPTSSSRLTLSRLGQSGSIPGLVLPSGSMAARHRKGVAAE
ncbi:hypothetical protein T265_05337 [Opisthorchis viverrini]|uniref:Uncharacterized protein n=1 Tax=Opisthorchis viverrini TaxID=6198 RepID=A0A074ZJV1_OPIVI|nr:hypothetical protein T265_05337 [Opisthorchis viverrini]KER27613.1 hypothetical protein T265_05337 [Opisthorchis viverrini]